MKEELFVRERDLDGVWVRWTIDTRAGSSYIRCASSPHPPVELRAMTSHFSSIVVLVRVCLVIVIATPT